MHTQGLATLPWNNKKTTSSSATTETITKPTTTNTTTKICTTHNIIKRMIWYQNKNPMKLIKQWNQNHQKLRRQIDGKRIYTGLIKYRFIQANLRYFKEKNHPHVINHKDTNKIKQYLLNKGSPSHECNYLGSKISGCICCSHCDVSPRIAAGTVKK